MPQKPPTTPMNAALGIAAVAALVIIQGFALLDLPAIWPGIVGRIAPVVVAVFVVIAVLEIMKRVRRRPDSDSSGR